MIVNDNDNDISNVSCEETNSSLRNRHFSSVKTLKTILACLACSIDTSHVFLGSSFLPFAFCVFFLASYCHLQISGFM